MEINDEEIYNWIDEYQLSRQKKNINRDFSDAVPLAEVLKHHYPKLVQLHNYSPRNSVAHKIINWNTLNRKVLSKININLSAAQMEDLSKAVPGVIERLLYKVKKNIEAKKLFDEKSAEFLVVEGLSAEITAGSVVPIKMRLGDKFTDQKIVPSEMYDKLAKDLMEKDETISVLKNKVKHLENLLAIKEERLKDRDELKKSDPDDNDSITNRISYKLFG